MPLDDEIGAAFDAAARHGVLNLLGAERRRRKRACVSSRLRMRS
jgi:hypothetical protein